MDERERKRRRRFGVQHSRCSELLTQLECLYAKSHSSFLWDTTKSWHLLRPARYFGHNLSASYVYVGRRGAQALFEKILDREAGQHIQVLGAKGSGKSTVICSIAGFLQGSRKRRVVYVHAKRFVDEPFKVLLDALLLSCREEMQWQGLASAETLDDLVLWCDEQPPGSLVFFVDDWDRFEVPGNESLEKTMKCACSEHVLVKLSSVNSRTRKIWSTDDKAYEDVETFFFDGPFESDELKTWIGQCTLSQAALEHVDRLTGGMPRLLLYLEQASGNESVFIRTISKVYTQKLHTEFASKLTTADELVAALDLLATGNLSILLANKDMTCFYRDDEDRYHPLSPYLRSCTENYIMAQDLKLKRVLQGEDMEKWVAAVRMDLDENGNSNPARVGWNIEGLLIAVMRYRRKVFNFEFKHYRTYERGQEKSAVESIPAALLREGVLLGPAAFNEKAVDVVYLKLEGSVLVIKAIQITIAQWKAKGKKESHKVWATQVLPKWKPRKPSWTSVSEEFYYVMPESVALSDIPNTKWKRFEDVDDALAEFDALLLDEPRKMAKELPKRCSATTRAGSPCGNKAYVDGDYLCFQHSP